MLGRTMVIEIIDLNYQINYAYNINCEMQMLTHFSID